MTTATVLGGAVTRRARRWWMTWFPAAALAGVMLAGLAWWYVAAMGIAGAPAPQTLWAWTAFTGAAVVVTVGSGRRSRWWQRCAALLAIPLCVLSCALALNGWVGYFPTVHAAWNQFTSGPLPDETDRLTVTTMQLTGARPTKGVVVPVTIGSASNFRHRRELVYLPPSWFSSTPPPRLPTVMMIGAALNTPADWLRAGDAVNTIDDFASHHEGFAPALVFVDATGTFSNDTECVNGPRGNAADHLTKDVMPFMVSNFGVSAAQTNWGIVGWSMGGTCAVVLATKHPDLFHSFVDIAGDIGPNTGDRAETIDTLFGGDADAWASFDPTTVMSRHGQYHAVSGWFDIASNPRAMDGSEPDTAGNPEAQDVAARSLCARGTAQGIRCALVSQPGKHDWPFAARAFALALPWLCGQLGTPRVPAVALPASSAAPTGARPAISATGR